MLQMRATTPRLNLRVWFVLLLLVAVSGPLGLLAPSGAPADHVSTVRATHSDVVVAPVRGPVHVEAGAPIQDRQTGLHLDLAVEPNQTYTNSSHPLVAGPTGAHDGLSSSSSSTKSERAPPAA
jgi:hypothetical protein